MGFVNGFPLNKIKEIKNPENAFHTIFDILDKFVNYGLIHGDFNDFNLMLDLNGKITVIDFP